MTYYSISCILLTMNNNQDVSDLAKISCEEIHMDIQSINTPEEYEAAQNRVEALFDAKAGTPEGDELDKLVDMIMVYEDNQQNEEEEHQEDNMTDVVADVLRSLASAGWGTDEDYCHDTPMGQEYGDGFDSGE